MTNVAEGDPDVLVKQKKQVMRQAHLHKKPPTLEYSAQQFPAVMARESFLHHIQAAHVDPGSCRFSKRK